MIGYRQHVERDLERWAGRGWIGREGLEAIRSDLASRKNPFGLAQVLAMLGAILLAFGAITFVAAHWNDMPRVLRLALIVGAMWAAYGSALALHWRQLPGFAGAAVMLGSALYGGGIMLVGQMYHMGGNPIDAVLTWALGTALAAILLRSNATYALAILLTGIWGALQTGAHNGVYWWFLLPWAGLAVAVALTTRWRPAFHLLALGLTVWVLSLGWMLGQGHQHMLVTAIGLGIMALAMLGGEAIDRHLAISRPTLCYGLAIAFGGLFAMQFLDWDWVGGLSPSPWLAANGMPLALLAAVSLALVLGALMHGARTENKPLVWLSYVGFSAELLAVYFKTIGTLLDNALFFLSAGLIVIALAWLAWRLHKRQAAHKEVQA